MTLDRLPSLPGPRIALRWLEHRDADDLFIVFRDAEVMRYWSRPPMVDRAEAVALVDSVHRHFTAKSLFQWGIEHRGRIIGHVTLAKLDPQNKTAEVGFALARDHWGKGLAKEALTLALNHGFQSLALRRVEADVDPRNARSLARLEGLGFRREGLLRERWLVGGEVQDSVLLGLLAREWRVDPDAGPG